MARHTAVKSTPIGSGTMPAGTNFPYLADQIEASDVKVVLCCVFTYDFWGWKRGSGFAIAITGLAVCAYGPTNPMR